MSDNLKAGRIVGTLFLAQLVTGIFLNFFILSKVLPLDAMTMGSETIHAVTLGIGLIVAITISSFSVINAAILYRIFSAVSPVHAVVTVALTAIGLGLVVVEYANVMELLMWAQKVAAATDSETRNFLEKLRPIVIEGRNRAHFMATGFSGFGLAILYLLLLRKSDVPRLLTCFGVLAALAQVTAISHTFFGMAIPYVMLAPLALAQLVLPAWFIFKGIGLKAGTDQVET